MKETIRYQKNVLGDLDGIFQAYESISLETANKVRDDLARSLELIGTFPEMHATVDGDIRVVKTKQYPLLIQYEIVNEIPLVLSVYHADLGENKIAGENSG